MVDRPAPTRPWGLTRMAPYVSRRTSIWPARMVIDPVTQVGRYFDHCGEVMPIFEASARGDHGSLDQTNRTYTTGGTQDGAPDTDYETDQDRD